MSISDESSGLQRIKKGAEDSRAAACEGRDMAPSGESHEHADFGGKLWPIKPGDF